MKVCSACKTTILDFSLAIVQTLEHFTKLPNTRKPGLADATSLLYPICNFHFVVAIVILQIYELGFYERHHQITTREIT